MELVQIHTCVIASAVLPPMAKHVPVTGANVYLQSWQISCWERG